MERNLGKQRGGTLLGVVIGLVAGLAIAVVVALMISKSSAPLSNKQSRSDKITEPTASSAADPNKPLYGKQDAAKEAAKDFVKESSPKAEAQADVKPVAAEVKDKQEVKPATPDKPPAEKPKKPEATKEPVKEQAAKPARADDKWIYYLQAGAYREQGDAENARARLALLGFEARISEMAAPSGTLYRVRLGPYGQVDAMNRVRSKLTEGGVDAVVVRTPK